MAYKIAVASSDGKVINQHFGRATQFLIFNIEAGKFEFDKLTTANPFCGGGEHDDNRLQSAAEALKGCRAVLVSQIGNGAVIQLARNGIDAFDVRDFIDVALDKLIKYYAKIDGGKNNG